MLLLQPPARATAYDVQQAIRWLCEASGVNPGEEWIFDVFTLRALMAALREPVHNRVQGEDDLLTVEADGKEVLSVRDSTLTNSGHLSFYTWRGEGVVKKAEVLLLHD